MREETGGFVLSVFILTGFIFICFLIFGGAKFVVENFEYFIIIIPIVAILLLTLFNKLDK